VCSCYGSCYHLLGLGSYLCHGFLEAESQNGWGWQGSLEVHPPCSRRATSSRLPRAVSRQLLNISKAGDSTASLGSLCWCTVTLTAKKCFLKPRQHLLHFGVCLWPLVPSLGTTEKSLALASLYPPFRYLYTLMRSLLSLFFSWLNSPSSLSLSS